MVFCYYEPAFEGYCKKQLAAAHSMEETAGPLPGKQLELKVHGAWYFAEPSFLYISSVLSIYQLLFTILVII